jgi:spore germination protein YaaH
VYADLRAGVPEPPLADFPSKKPISGKINMMWDQVFSIEENAHEFRRVPREGLDVLSPTWFKFDLDLSGDIISLADLEYVNWAHEQGYQVWPLIDDFSLDLNILRNMDVAAGILPDTNKREHVINQLMGFIAMYNLDGINIDFEYIQPETASHYVQFFRELSPYMRLAGKVLSVDMYTPLPGNPWSKHYSRDKISELADYICMMGYDETIGAPSGPNASLPFIRDGIELTLEEVPREKLILGYPTYIRYWRVEEVDDEIREIPNSESMRIVNKMFADNNADISWDDAYGSYFATYTEGSVTYKAWLEEERSLEEKFKIMQNEDLAGVSAWKRGLEAEEVWDLLLRYTS